jgi:hypothetical protein
MESMMSSLTTKTIHTIQFPRRSYYSIRVACLRKKNLLGFDFKGEDKTLWLKEGKQNKILTILHCWLRKIAKRPQQHTFSEFESVVI